MPIRVQRPISLKITPKGMSRMLRCSAATTSYQLIAVAQRRSSDETQFPRNPVFSNPIWYVEENVPL